MRCLPRKKKYDEPAYYKIAYVYFPSSERFFYGVQFFLLGLPFNLTRNFVCIYSYFADVLRLSLPIQRRLEVYTIFFN